MKLTKQLTHQAVTLSVPILAVVLAAGLHAQTHPGKAKVQAITGSAVFSVAGGPAVPLKVGTILDQGATVKTAKDSSVDLFLGKSVGVLRLVENTTLSLDKLAMIETGADTVVDVQLNLPDGTMLFNVEKLAAASKYDIKIPNGVAGIRGTRGRISSAGFIVLREGRFVFVHVPPGGQPKPYTLVAPPTVYFTPVEGVKAAPPELIRELDNQMRGLGLPGAGPGAGTEPPPPKRRAAEEEDYQHGVLNLKHGETGRRTLSAKTASDVIDRAAREGLIDQFTKEGIEPPPGTDTEINP
ncbi:MAG: FecR domain-containing protein [Verrucomicrobia bacterium]|nr:FecR domain-containing protein [Verrucomicrobiota bacterium]